MLKARIDATTYPVVRVESKNRIIPPSHAMHILEFEPKKPNDPYLLYFKEDENEDEKILKRYVSTFAQCRVDTLQHSVSRRIEGKRGTKRTTKEVDRRLASSKHKN